MTKPIVLALAVSALVAFTGPARAQTPTPVQTPECLKYQPESVQLVGHLERLTYPDGSNFSRGSSGDMPETGFYLRLAHPVCTITDTNNQGQTDVALLQLIVDTTSLRSIAGKEVVIRGTLLPATNAHHHTPVILMPNLPVTLYKAP